MKALKLRRVDKWGVVIAITLPLFAWFWLYWPPQRCKVHGVWLRTGKATLGYTGSAYGYECRVEGGCPEAGMASYSETVEFQKFPERNKPIRYCPRCRGGLKLILHHEN